jgi:hypothetical protein
MNDAVTQRRAREIITELVADLALAGAVLEWIDEANLLGRVNLHWLRDDEIARRLNGAYVDVSGDEIGRRLNGTSYVVGEDDIPF